MMHGSAFDFIDGDFDELPQAYLEQPPPPRQTNHRQERRGSPPRRHHQSSPDYQPDDLVNRTRQISISRSSSSGSGKPRRVKEIDDHQRELETLARPNPRAPTQPRERKFLKKVQHELEEQREEWKDEINRLEKGSLLPTGSLPKDAHVEGTNSFVDTSSGIPTFTALFDVKGFSPKNITVNVDKLTNKCIVQCHKRDTYGAVTRTFTHKIQLQRFTDDERLTSHLSKSGVLKLEVPLVYYFPTDKKNPGSRDVKSFVYEVRKDQDGGQTLEILVNTGPGVRAKDLHVQVTDDNVLLVLAEHTDDRGRRGRKLIKKYTLPDMADVDRTRSRLGKDGRLVILVPVKRH